MEWTWSSISTDSYDFVWDIFFNTQVSLIKSCKRGEVLLERWLHLLEHLLHILSPKLEQPRAESGISTSFLNMFWFFWTTIQYQMMNHQNKPVSWNLTPNGRQSFMASSANSSLSTRSSLSASQKQKTQTSLGRVATVQNPMRFQQTRVTWGNLAFLSFWFRQSSVFYWLITFRYIYL